VVPAGEFDLVFTGVSALCWLPDIRRWAGVVESLLRPGGRLFLREGHPMMWAMDERITDRVELAFPYFEVPEPLVWDDADTYVPTDVQLAHSVTHSWNHGIGEIITALLDRRLTLTQFVEHDSVPWEAFPGRMEQTTLDEWRLADRPSAWPTATRSRRSSQAGRAPDRRRSRSTRGVRGRRRRRAVCRRGRGGSGNRDAGVPAPPGRRLASDGRVLRVFLTPG
jgi:hypothetical protein